MKRHLILLSWTLLHLPAIVIAGEEPERTWLQAHQHTASSPTYTLPHGRHVSFHRAQGGTWRAQVVDAWQRVQELPVVGTPGRSLEEAIGALRAKTPREHRSGIHVLDKTTSPGLEGWVYVGPLGVRGGVTPNSWLLGGTREQCATRSTEARSSGQNRRPAVRRERSPSPVFSFSHHDHHFSSASAPSRSNESARVNTPRPATLPRPDGGESLLGHLWNFLTGNKSTASQPRPDENNGTTEAEDKTKEVESLASHAGSHAGETTDDGMATQDSSKTHSSARMEEFMAWRGERKRWNLGESSSQGEDNAHITPEYLQQVSEDRDKAYAEDTAYQQQGKDLKALRAQCKQVEAEKNKLEFLFLQLDCDEPHTAAEVGRQQAQKEEEHATLTEKLEAQEAAYRQHPLYQVSENLAIEKQRLRREEKEKESWETAMAAGPMHHIDHRSLKGAQKHGAAAKARREEMQPDREKAQRPSTPPRLHLVGK